MAASASNEAGARQLSMNDASLVSAVSDFKEQRATLAELRRAKRPNAYDGG
jgi:hypothetical protein